MRSLWSLLIFIGIVSLLTGCGPKTYTLQYAPKQGETYTYKMSVSGAQNMGLTMSMTPVKVEGDKIVVETRMSDMAVNGTPVPGAVGDMFKSMVITTTYDRRGHSTGTEVSGVSPQMGALMKGQGSGTTIGYPDTPVKVGDSWTGETDVQGQKLKTTYKFVRVETVSGKEAAVIEGTMDPSAPIKLSGPMALDIEIATGMPLSASFEGQAGGQQVKFSMTRA